MKLTYKILCFLLSLIFLASVGCATIYAEPEDGDNTSSGDIAPAPDEPVQDIPAQDTPADSNTSSPEPDYSGDGDTDYNSGNNNYSNDSNYSDDSYSDGNSYNFADDEQSGSFDFTQNDNGSSYDNSQDYSPDNSLEESDGSSYEDPTESSLYNVSGSVDTNTLSSDDWKLNLNTTGAANGTGDFNFIKNNNSSIDSNFSIFILIGGVALIIASIITMAIVIRKTMLDKKAVAAGNVPSIGENRKKQRTARKNTHHYRKSDTAEIDIKQRKKR